MLHTSALFCIRNCEEWSCFSFDIKSKSILFSVSSGVLCPAGLWVSVPGREESVLLLFGRGQATVQLDSGWTHTERHWAPRWKSWDGQHHSETTRVRTSGLLSQESRQPRLHGREDFYLRWVRTWVKTARLKVMLMIMVTVHQSSIIHFFRQASSSLIAPYPMRHTYQSGCLQQITHCVLSRQQPLPPSQTPLWVRRQPLQCQLNPPIISHPPVKMDLPST